MSELKTAEKSFEGSPYSNSKSYSKWKTEDEIVHLLKEYATLERAVEMSK